jgi:hypothetical protein
MRNTPALTHWGISSFGLVTPRMSVGEKQKPRDLHREAFTQTCEPVLLKSVGLTGSVLTSSLQS